jgi:CRISPR-associated protein Csb2
VSHYLCISVTFLDPLFHGWGDDEPEWPPSPMRLFQALLAGALSGCRGSQWSKSKAEAFRWLGRRDPPLIVTPATRSTIGCTLFVPNNDSDKAFDRQDRLTSKTARPHRLCDGDTVYYLWSVDETDGAAGHVHAEAIRREARNLLALGWGIDQVVGNGQILTDAEAAALPGHRWRAWKGCLTGGPTWRVPTADSLDDLECVYQSFLHRVDGKQYRPPLKLTRFETVTYMSATAMAARPRAVFELPDRVAFRQEDAAKVAAMLRSLASRRAQEDTHEFPGGSETYVAGHTEKQRRTPPRFSYLPLPTIGHEHADGMIRRLLIAEPFGGDGIHAQWAQNRLRNTTLQDQEGNQRGILLDLWRPNSNAMIRRYVDEAPTWCTVTPVIVPGFDDGKHSKAEKLLLTAVQQADLPIDAVAELTMRKAPFWPGSQHPRQYFAPDYLKHLSGWHVRLVFREPIPGPLAIGAGRHAGLGIFAVSEEEVRPLRPRPIPAG